MIDFIKNQLYSRRIKRFISLVLVLVVVLILGYSLLISKNSIKNIEWKLDFDLILITFILYSFGLCFISIAWLSIMRKLGSNEKSTKHLMVFLGSLVARRIPFPIWYIGSRFYFYNNSSVSKKNIAFATIIEIALTGFSGIFMLFILLGLFYREIGFGIIALLILIISVYLFSHRDLLRTSINFVLTKFQREPVEFNFGTKVFLNWFFLYAISWLFSGFTFYNGIKAVIEIDITPIAGILFSMISGLVGYVSMVLPAGFGLKELTTGFLLSQSIPIGLGIIMGIINRIFTTITEVFWSLILILFNRNNP